MRKKFLLSVLLVLMFVWAGSAFSATIGLRAKDPSIVDEGVIIVEPCTVFELDLYIEGMAALPTVSPDNPWVGFVLDIAWDPLVAFEGFNNNLEWWTTIDVSPTPDQGLIPPKVELNGYAAAVAPSEDHVIGTFVLHCMGPGETALAVEPRFEFPFNLSLADGSFIDDSVSFESVVINQVPIPGALLLLGSGLLGLIGLRKKIKKA
jgi:hypothetical protein